MSDNGDKRPTTVDEALDYLSDDDVIATPIGYAIFHDPATGRYQILRIERGVAKVHAKGIETRAAAQEIADALNRNAVADFLGDSTARLFGLGAIL